MPPNETRHRMSGNNINLKFDHRAMPLMKTAHYVAGWLLALGMVAGFAAEPRRIRLETREVLLGKLPSNVVPKTPTVTPDASRLAYVVLDTNQQP
jgi:hypothetical protein